MAPLILDGRTLAAAREGALRRRAAAVEKRRGHPPRVLMLAFANEEGAAPWVRGKVRACTSVGIEVESLLVPAGVETEAAVTRFSERVEAAEADGVFVQFPFPAGLDGAALTRAIPTAADIDLMHPDRVRDYLAGGAGDPPLTVRAILTLLDAHDLPLRDLQTTVVAHGTAFDRTLAEALRRRGAVVHIAAPEASAADLRETAAGLVVTVVGHPGGVSAADLPAGSVVVDGGYFNPGGRGDVDVSGGVEHLRALAPVPGGVGPMTVSLLLEAVVERAEASM